MAYRCEAHRRESKALLSDFECPQCAYEKQRAEEERAFAEERDRQGAAQAADRHRALMEERAREAEVEAERHRDLMEARAREVEAADDRHRDVMELERIRLRAEREWREAQELEQRAELRRRQLREGLPNFSDEFQDEWASLNERLLDVLERERELAEALEAARASDAAHRRHLSACMTQLFEYFSTNPPDALSVAPPREARPAWPALQRAFTRLMAACRDNPYVRVPHIDETWSGEDLFRVWLVLRGLGGLNSVTPFEFSLRDYRSRPGGVALGCAGLLFLSVPVALGAALVALQALRLDVSLAYLAAAGLALVPSVMVAIQVWFAPSRRRALLEGLSEFHGAVCALAKTQRGATDRWGTLSLESLQRSDDAVPIIRNRFALLADEIGAVVALASGSSLVRVLPRLDTEGRGLADAVIGAMGGAKAASDYLREIESHSPSAEDQQVKASFAFMESEIRSVGHQIISGVRLSTARIRLVRCPACSGPVTPRTGTCPYCGSQLVEQRP